MLWPKRLYAGLWLRRSRLDPITVHVGFMVGRVEGLEMQWWRRMEKFCWTDRVWNEEVLTRFKEGRNMLPTIKIRKVEWIGHILHRNCLLKHVIKGRDREKDMWQKDEKEDVSSSWMILREKRGYWKLKDESKDIQISSKHNRFIILYHFRATCFHSLESSSGPLMNWPKTI